nr:MAG TPA: hypothetical protein [Caudoviricetes sp.]
MTPIATAKTTTSNDEDRYRIKLGIHAVLDAILDARDTLPSSPHSCSYIQLRIHTQLQDAHASMMHALYLTNLEDED